MLSPAQPFGVVLIGLGYLHRHHFGGNAACGEHFQLQWRLKVLYLNRHRLLNFRVVVAYEFYSRVFKGVNLG